MRPEDIRPSILERIGPLRHRPLQEDREEGDRVINSFVEKVAKRADSLPLCVNYVIGDTLAQRYKLLNEEEDLPQGLAAYHEELLRRCSIGDLQQVLTPIVTTLTIAREPLSAPALSALLVQRGIVLSGEDGHALVEKGLGAIASMIRRLPTSDESSGFILYHASLREHALKRDTIRQAVATARQAMARTALAPEATGDAGAYLYRFGIGHPLDEGRRVDALGLLNRFDYLMRRLHALPNPGGAMGIDEDWRAVLAADGKPLTEEQRLWEAFSRENAHLLRRAMTSGPATRYCSSSPWSMPTTVRRRKPRKPGKAMVTGSGSGGRNGCRTQPPTPA